MKKVVGLSILALFCFSVGLAWFIWDRYANQKNLGPANEVLFEVKPGESFSAVVKELEKAHLIQNGPVFSLYAKIRGEAGKVKVGEYAIRQNMYPSEVLAIINSGKSIGRAFTVPEGMNIYEIAEMYEDENFGTRDEFLRWAKDKDLIRTLLGEGYDSMEGFLFPETYSLTKFTDAKGLIVMMYHKFQSVWNEVEPILASSGLTKKQVVTLASIIEKETGAPEERPTISSVFHNRMKKGMLLQTDPTVLYGKADLTGKMIISITRADLSQPTRYNTYVIKGLPPGPISNPSKEALLAAVKPATTEFLFFVSKNQGTHIFSKDYEAHNRAVKQFQLDAKAREGKSWRDLKKQKVNAASH